MVINIVYATDFYKNGMITLAEAAELSGVSLKRITRNGSMKKERSQ